MSERILKKSKDADHEKKKYTEGEFRAGIKAAALKSATAAVEGVRAKDDLRNDEKKELLKDLNRATTKDAKAVDPTKVMEAAIKRSVLK
jgi:hypothetical protein